MIIDISKTVLDLLTEQGQALQGFEKILDIPVYCVDYSDMHQTVVWEITEVNRVEHGVNVVRKGTYIRGCQSAPETRTAFHPDRGAVPPRYRL